MDRWPGLEVEGRRSPVTPYGPASAAILEGRFHGYEALFLARHGAAHTIPPHRINYRANIWALREAGARAIVGVGAVGGIAPWMEPAALAVPRDLVDYTWGREHTYSDGEEGAVFLHVDMSETYDRGLRAALLEAASRAAVTVAGEGILGVTQGPRLETAAEILRMKRDGCDMVGMTGMPEAALARELGLRYASLAVSVNWAAGLSQLGIHDEIYQSMEEGMAKVQRVLQQALEALS